MAVKFKTYVDGTAVVQIDADKFTYMLKQSGTVTGTLNSGPFGGGNYTGSVTITGCTRPLMFVPFDCLVFSTQDNGGGSFTFTLLNTYNASMPYMCFDIGLGGGGTAGLRLRNSLGQITFDSEYAPLLLAAVGTEKVSTGISPATTVPTGRIYYYSGGGSNHQYSGSLLFGSEYELVDEINFPTVNGSGVMSFAPEVVFVSTTNNPSVDAYSAPSAWLLADVTGIVGSPPPPPPPGTFIGALTKTLANSTLSSAGTYTGAGFPAITISSAYDNITLNPPPLNGFTGARTLTFTGGGSRNISISHSLSAQLAYSINGGAYVTYGTAFAITSGQTVQFRYSGQEFDEFASVDVIDVSNSSVIDSFLVSVTYP